MEIEIADINPDNQPHKPTRKSLNMKRVFDYIRETKDGSVVRNDVIKKIIFIEKTSIMKVMLENYTFEISAASLEGLRTHSFIVSSIHSKLSLEDLWDLIEKDVSLFQIEDYFIKKFLQQNFKRIEHGVTYTEEHIFVNGVCTFIPTNEDNVRFVYGNLERWL